MSLATNKPYWLGNVVPVSSSEASELYWSSDIPAAEIASAYFPGVHTNQLPDVVGRAYTPFACDLCENPVMVASRTTAQSVFVYRRKFAKSVSPYRKHYFSLFCESCAGVGQERQEAAQREEQRRRDERERELRTMPYRDYLQTPEWADRRSGALRRARYRCQTCAEGGKLHVHHRTYVRRGAEYSSDLIVLCADCHRLFHERRSLADGGRAAA